MGADPLEVAFCHCTDCRRWTSSPAPAFAAFTAVEASETLGEGRSFAPGVRRWICPDCGSAMMAQFDYLPGQTYVPLGVIDQAEALVPEVHCHADKRLSWLHIDDGKKRISGTARAHLNAASGEAD